MEWIRSWAGQIIVAVIIATLLEMILPEGKNKKYIKMVIGVYVVFCVISPIIAKITNAEEILDIKQYEQYFNTSTSVSTQTLSEHSDSTILTIYEDNLKNDIKVRLKEKGYVVTSIQTEIEMEDTQTYGSIKTLTLAVQEQQTKQDEEQIKRVNKIQIGNQVEEKKQKENRLTQGQKEQIKELIYTVYQVEKENIMILE